jgi:hypothetical protein
MIKELTKERVVEYSEKAIICDLCGGEVTPGNIIITLTPAVAQPNAARWHSNQIDVCSVDCLTKNIGAASLLLNTKVVPELRSTHSKESRERLNLSSELQNVPHRLYAYSSAGVGQRIP